MDKRALECFIALAEELHFHRAARRCHISQPGLSQQLRRLEDLLQVQLVLRSNRQVSLTRAGTVFLAEARKILKTMDGAVEMARETEKGIVGHLRIGATASALFILLPEITARFSEALPDVHLYIDHLTTSEQEAALRNNEIHVGVCHPPLTDPALECELLAELQFDVVLSDRNPLAGRPWLTMKDLVNQTFILFPRDVGPRLYDQIIALCHDEGYSPRQIVEAVPAQSIVAMAACDVGIGFVASKVQHYDRPPAVYRKLRGPAPRLTLGGAHAGGRISPLVRQFLDIAVEVGAAVE